VGLEGLARFRASRGRPAVRLPEDPIAYSLALLAFPFLLPLLLSSTPWLPPESIVSGGSVVVGYVTQTDSRWTHILLDAPRVVRIYETSAITSRTSCQMPSRALDATLLQIVAQPSALPDCRVP